MSTASFRRYEYRRLLPHYQRDERPLFVTFRTSSRFTLSCEARTLVLQHCFHDHGKTIHLHAVVVMPDHVHLLFTALRMLTVGLSLCRKSFGPSRGICAQRQ
jgi:hypothetical protein